MQNDPVGNSGLPHSENVPEAAVDASREETTKHDGLPHAEPPRAPEPLELESEAAPTTCPNCGAPLRGANALLCLRCGYDLQHLKVHETRAGAIDHDAGDEGDTDGRDHHVPALVRHAPGDPYVPIALIAIAAAVVLAGLLFGAPGLFGESVMMPVEGGAEMVAWRARFTSLLRLPFQIGIWTLCGVAALFVSAWWFDRPLGDLKVGALRMGAIVLLARAISFIDIERRAFEFTVEALAQAALALLVLMALYRLKPRDAVIVLAMMISAFGVLYAIALGMVWAIR